MSLHFSVEEEEEKIQSEISFVNDDIVLLLL